MMRLVESCLNLVCRIASRFIEPVDDEPVVVITLREYRTMNALIDVQRLQIESLERCVSDMKDLMRRGL